MPSLSTSTSPVSSAAPTNKKLSPREIAGIAIGSLSLFIAAVLVLVLVLWCHKRIERAHECKERGDQRKQGVPSSVTPINWRIGMDPKERNDIDRLIAFLALFGSDGILLRELIMLASLRLTPNVSHNHWLTTGERGELLDAINARTTCRFLGAFLRETSTVQSIENFQIQLEKLGLIDVDYQRARGARAASQQSWFIDERIWRISEDKSYARQIAPESLLDVFLEVFTEMPCKDVSPLAERQRELYYYHAHQAIVCSYSFLIRSHLDSRDMRQVVIVILQLLSHRFQKDDEALLGFARENLPESGLHRDWHIILLVAELKATLSTNYENFSQLRDRVLQVGETSVIRGDSSPRAKGLSGWLLVELLDAVEAQDRVELIDAVVQTGKQWMQRFSGATLSTLEQTMLCRAFARFGDSDHPEPPPPQHNLLFGYQLSRAGCMVKAEELLLSGLEYYASSIMSTRIWSYRFELVSLMLRAARWSEAEAWLASARNSAMNRNWAVRQTDFWKLSGECGETFILLGLYQADCEMAMGKLKPAEARLKITLEETLFARDSYIQSLRLALRTRLLNVQMWQEIWERATVTAQDLVEDIVASGQTLSTIRSSCSVIVIVLTLIDKLLWVGDMLAAARLLESIKRFEDAYNRVLPLDIKLYVEWRRAAISQLSSLEGSKIYGRPLREPGDDAEDAVTFAPGVDHIDWEPHANPLRGQGPTSVNVETRAIETKPSHSRPDLLQQSSAYKWSLELEHARFPAPEAEEIYELEAQSHEAKELDTKDNAGAQTARHGLTNGRILCLGVRKGAVHRGNTVAERLAQAPHPPTHEPRDHLTTFQPNRNEVLRRSSTGCCHK